MHDFCVLELAYLEGYIRTYIHTYIHTGECLETVVVLITSRAFTIDAW